MPTSLKRRPVLLVVESARMVSGTVPIRQGKRDAGGRNRRILGADQGHLWVL